jgi:hypothetical protein
MTEMMYNDFWADSSTPKNECEARKVKFECAQNRFQLEFVGKYEESSSKTILTSWNNEDEVILDVCERCVEKGMRELAKAFPVFRPRAPFYFDGEEIYSHMGQKEDVETDKKYEILQPYKDKHGQIAPVYSISAGLDYPGVGPEHAYLHDIGRAEYVAITDDEAVNAFEYLSKTEGIIPAIESAHAVAYAMKLAPTLDADKIIVITISGRGDKDCAAIARYRGENIDE